MNQDDYYRDKMRQEEEDRSRMLKARIEQNLRGMALIDILVEIVYDPSNFKDRMQQENQ